MDPLTIALLIGAAYAAAPIDGTTLALTRGVRGAWRGARKARKDRVRAAVKGWNSGKKTAATMRRQGRDPWSRIVAGGRAVRDASVATKQAGGRLGNGVVAGARGAGRGARWVRDHGHTANAWSSRLAARLAERIRNRQARRNATTTEEANPETTPTPEPAPVDVDEDLGPTWVNNATPGQAGETVLDSPENDPGVDSPLDDPYAEVSRLLAESQRRNADKLWLEDTSTWTATAGRRWINEHTDEIQAATSPEDLDIVRDYMADLRSRLPVEHGPDAAPLAWVDEIETAVAARLAEFGAPYNPVTADRPGLWVSVNGGKQRRAEYVLTPDLLEKVRGHIADGHTGGAFDGRGDPISSQDAEARIEALRARGAADDRFFQLRASGYTGPIDQDGQAVDDLDAWIEQHRPTSTTTAAASLTDTEGNPMQINEFSTVDDLEIFLRQTREQVTAIAEQIAPVRKAVEALPELWESAEWGTQALDQAVANLSDTGSGLRALEQLSESLVEELHASEVLTRRSRVVGEAAAEVGARGNVAAFQGA